MRRYERRPWHSSSGTRNRNWEMATSHACTACEPSLPLIPMPTWAPWIIGTSFAPSPMASATVEGLILRTSCTILSFCIGLSRVHAQARLAMPSEKISSQHSWSSRATVRVLPSSTRPVSCTPWISLWHLSKAALADATVSCSIAYTSFVDLPKSRQERAMFTHVSVLSPVRIHSLAPASFTVSMASGTPSWRRSSRAVTPRKVSPVSIFDSSSAIFLSLLRPRMREALLYSDHHLSK
mmetsp:Transcript_59019/g.173252  ORF Transcript_59019/g.173252 Transcript_59019/m.173252 type:complete len:238 (-) Transcript_59019:383-1096(-)